MRIVLAPVLAVALFAILAGADSPPLLVLFGGASIVIEAGTGFVEAGFSATDDVDGDIASSVVVLGTVNTLSLGNYTVEYTVANSRQLSSTATRVYTVVDRTPPRILLSGDSLVVVADNATYQDAGATAFDSFEGNLTSGIVTTGVDEVQAAITTPQYGVYTVQYTASDSSLNTVSVSRTVYVIASASVGVSFQGLASITINATKTPMLPATFLPYPSAFLTGTQNVVSDVRQYGLALVNASRLGTYTVLYAAIDDNGNYGSFTALVTVVDQEPPNMRFQPDVRSYTLDAAADFTYPSVNVTDNHDAASAIRIVLHPLPALRVVGSTIVFSYEATDSQGNTATLNGSVLIVDTTAPSIQLTGPNPLLVNYGTAFADPGAVASDLADGPVAVTVISSNVDTQPATLFANFTVLYQAQDSSGNKATASRIVTIVDTMPPAISLIGSVSIEQEAGSLYVESGATAFDLFDKSVNVVVQNGNLPLVHTSVPQTYTVLYSAEDSSGNKQVARRNVTFSDRTRPTLKLRGPDSVVVEAAVPYVDSGATAFDSYAGDLTALIQVSFFRIDRGQSIIRYVAVPSIETLQAGSMFQVQYAVSDPSGNQAASVLRNVSVVDTTAPTLDLTVPAVTYLEAARPAVPYTVLGAAAFDTADGNLTAAITLAVTSSTGSSNSLAFINTAATLPTKYTLVYTVVDSSGNSASAVTREVVLRDTTSPVLTLRGDNPLMVRRHAVLTDPLATAYDSYDGDISSRISSTWSQVNTSAPGGTSFTVVYQVTDSQGNAARVVSRIVQIMSPSGSSSSTNSALIAVIVAVVVIIICMVVILVVWVVWQRRDRKQRRELQEKFYATYAPSHRTASAPVLQLHGYDANQQIYSEINDDDEFHQVQAALRDHEYSAVSPPLPARNETLSFAQGRPKGERVEAWAQDNHTYDSLDEPLAKRDSVIRHRDIEHVVKPWFQEKLDRAGSEAFLSTVNVEGIFIVRPNQSQAGLFTLSMFANQRVYHFKITLADDGYRLPIKGAIGQIGFPNLVDLVEFGARAGCGLPASLLLPVDDD